MEDIDENVAKGVQSIKENMLKSPGANSWKASKYRRWIRQLIVIQAVNGTGAEKKNNNKKNIVILLINRKGSIID